jgi:hypothetical protein
MGSCMGFEVPLAKKESARVRYECTTLPLYVTEIATSYCTVTAWHDGSTGQGTQDTMEFPQIRAGKGANPQPSGAVATARSKLGGKTVQKQESLPPRCGKGGR